MNRTRWRLLVACLAVIGAAIAVAGGSAGNRDGDVTFEALPGPGAVTYGENIAYRSTFDEHDTARSSRRSEFVQTRPVATLDDAHTATSSTSAASLSIDTKNDADPANDELVCDVRRSSGPGRPAKVTSLSGHAPADIAAPRVRRLPDRRGHVAHQGAEADQRERDVPASDGRSRSRRQLLAGHGSTRRSRRAATSSRAATVATARASARTRPSVSTNPVTSSFCLPPFDDERRDRRHRDDASPS